MYNLNDGLMMIIPLYIARYLRVNCMLTNKESYEKSDISGIE
jgi:hypothetical protein